MVIRKWGLLLCCFFILIAQNVFPDGTEVVSYLKVLQDIASEEQKLLSSMEDNYAHTFNNALCAMAFILEGEKERAERILDFYAEATVVDNEDITLQNFFYKGEPRGFYQQVLLNDAEVPRYHRIKGTYGGDRWIGDMAWLLLAYKFYERQFKSKKYLRITGLIKDLLVSYYKQAKVGGYIQHGWRRDDTKLHENYGHEEGNIDCYAALILCGEKKIAKNIKKWLDNRLKKKKGLPLDLYTWRVLAFGKDYKDLLELVENDTRYKKQVVFNGKTVTGFFSGPTNVDNIWIDGLGHIACAYYSVANTEKGDFYVREMEKLIIEKELNGVKVKTLPYTANTSGGYEWVDVNKGFTSAVCWYIFAKHKFNPFTLEIHS
ncbi:MAG: hypothetical protein NZ928_02290 [Endomicrobia bacterium]|nr:hypothetical protein [Endomicrobiia bacterium]MDW8055787.1 hypothetical protein [Elusimicrobiota bacterium]